VSSLSSQAASGLGYAGQMSGLSQEISMFSSRAAQARGLAGIGSAIAGLGSSAMSYGIQTMPASQPGSNVSPTLNPYNSPGLNMAMYGTP
jgi:hypothetical protein